MYIYTLLVVAHTLLAVISHKGSYYSFSLSPQKALYGI